jgi:hypothetical protein
MYEQRSTALDDCLRELRVRAVRIAHGTTSLDELADALLAMRLSDTNDDACLVALRV